MVNVLNRSFTLNLLLILFATLKIVVSAFMLIFYGKRCSQPLDLWLILMIGSDFLHIFTIIVEIAYSFNIFRASPRRQNNINGNEAIINGNNNNHNNENNENYDHYIDIEQQNYEAYDAMQNLEDNNKLFFWFKQISRMYFNIFNTIQYIFYLVTI